MGHERSIMDIATQAPIQSGKAKAPTNGDKAKGAALATVCVNYATKRMEQEEKEQGKLRSIMVSISNLARDGHAEFRAELTKELNLLKELRATTGVTKAQTAGYSFNSFEVLVSNWKTMSTAVECGLSIADKPWGQALSEAVAMKHAHAANSAEGAQLPTKRKAGRKATPILDKTIAAATALLEDDEKKFLDFAVWVENTAKALKNKAKTVH